MSTENLSCDTLQPLSAEAKESSDLLTKETQMEHPGFDYWRQTLKSAKYVVAPMVDASELAWRMLSRKYGAELCYTPMLHSSVFVRDWRYRKENLESCSEDRPLIVQFCSNDPATFARACSLAAPYCDGIDLNLGCPQAIAKRGHYGAFLMEEEEWKHIAEMIKKAQEEVSIPISAKIRVFPEIEKTVEYARMLVDAGVMLLTVHGRTREQKGALTGVASWEHIKAVRQSVNVPVFANGNIQYLSDVNRCLDTTGVQGVMTAEGNLYNPAIFTEETPFACKMALEYLGFAKTYPCPLSFSRGHVFKILQHVFSMSENANYRLRMSKACTLESMTQIIQELEKSLEDYINGTKIWSDNLNEADTALLSLPLSPWLCQPYVRKSAEEHLKKMALLHEKGKNEMSLKRDSQNDENQLSRKKRKKLERNPNKKFEPAEPVEKCICKNPKGGRCAYGLCRSCCRFKCHIENLECIGHKLRKRKETNQPIQTERLNEETLLNEIASDGMNLNQNSLKDDQCISEKEIVSSSKLNCFDSISQSEEL